MPLVVLCCRLSHLIRPQIPDEFTRACPAALIVSVPVFMTLYALFLSCVCRASHCVAPRCLVLACCHTLSQLLLHDTKTKMTCACILSHIPWRVTRLLCTMLQELLLRHCVAALLSWNRIAALEGKRTSLLAQHLRREHQLRSVRLAFKAWHDVAAAATAQSSFVMQLLSVEDRVMLTSSLRAWRAQCHSKQNVSRVR